MGSPSHMAVFYDGASNRKRRVVLRFGSQLEIMEDGERIATWPYGDVRRVESHAGLRLSAVSAPSLARLEIGDAATAAQIRARCPGLDRGTGQRQTGRIVAWSLGAVASILLITIYGIPLVVERLVPLIPRTLEQRLGRAVDNQVRVLMPGDNCTHPDGRRALDKMVARLLEGSGGKADVDVQVITSSIPNAVALPGGRIYVFDGILRRANGPDEIAGVIAHEIGHVEHRDGLRRLLQTGGTSYLIGLLFGDIMGGGAVVIAARTLLDASYSREAETSADDFAISTMKELGRSPAPLGELLVRLTGSKGGRGSIVDSHPVSADRLERMKAAAPPKGGPPILTDAEWQALKTICPPPKKEERKVEGKPA